MLRKFTDNMKIPMTIGTKDYQPFGSHMMNLNTLFMFIETAVFANISSLAKKFFPLIVGESVPVRGQPALPVRVVLPSPIFSRTGSTTVFANSLIISFGWNAKLLSAIKTSKPIDFLKSLFSSLDPVGVVIPKDLFNSDNLSIRYFPFISHDLNYRTLRFISQVVLERSYV